MSRAAPGARRGGGGAMDLGWAGPILEAAGATAGAAAAPAAEVAPPQAGAAGVLVPLVQALAWPAVAVIALLVLRRPLLRLLGRFGTSVRTVEAFGFKLALAEPIGGSAAAPVVGLLRADAQVRLEDSGRQLLSQLFADAAPARYAIIDLEDGKAWLTSRLYITGVLLQALKGLEAFVFLETAGGVEGRLAAVAPVATVIARLGERHPWLEQALAVARLGAGAAGVRLQLAIPARPVAQVAGGAPVPGAVPPGLPGGLQVWPAYQASVPQQAQEVLSAYLSALQQPQSALLPAAPEGWTTFATSQGPVSEAGVWVDRGELRRLVDPAAFEAWMPEDPDEPARARVRRVLRRAGDLVALVDADRRFKALVDRRAMLEALAAAQAEGG